MRRVAAVLLFFLVACAEPLPRLEGIDLPPASMPDEIQQGGWSVAFTHEFGPGFWTEGDHAYQLQLSCPETGAQPVLTPPILFKVEAFNMTIEMVYLRLSGMADSKLGPPNLSAFNPGQDTTAIVTILGLSEEQARAAEESCVGTVTWDLTNTADLLPSEVLEQ